MNTKQKPKKGELSEKQICATIQIVKQYWPNYSITSADIRNPTKNFVLKFYTDCVRELDEKCTFVTRTNTLKEHSDVQDEEILLYRKLCKIPTLLDADFKLGDLYVFDPKRNNQYIFITIHFMLYTESIMDKMVQTCNVVFNIVDQQQNCKEKLKEIKEEKMQVQVNLTCSNMELKKQIEINSSLIPIYEEKLKLIEQSNARCKDTILEAEKLKTLTKYIYEEIKNIEEKQEQLQSKIVTEDEYQNLKMMHDSLAKEEENLHENDLLEHKKPNEYLQRCIEKSKHIRKPSENLFKLSKQRDYCSNLTKNIQYFQAIQESSEAELALLKQQLEEQIKILQEDNKKNGDIYKTKMEQIMVKDLESKEKFSNDIQELRTTISEYKQVLEKTENDFEKLMQVFKQQYENICNVQNLEIERFKSFLDKVKEVLNKH